MKRTFDASHSRQSPESMPAFCTNITRGGFLEKSKVKCRDCRSDLSRNAKPGDLCWRCSRHSRKPSHSSNASIPKPSTSNNFTPVKVKEEPLDTYPDSSSLNADILERLNTIKKELLDANVIANANNPLNQNGIKKESPEIPKNHKSFPEPSTSSSTNTNLNVSFQDYSDQSSSNNRGVKRKSDEIDWNAPKRFLPSPNLPLSSSNLKLNNEIWTMYWDRKQSDHLLNQKMSLKEELHQIILRIFSNCGLYIVGSTLSGLGDNSSDMDACLMLTDKEVDQKGEAIKVLNSLRKEFYKCGFGRHGNVQVIHANVPIIKLRDGNRGIDVDINVNNTVGIRNTQLLSSYARIDNRCPPLVLMVKLWARCHRINDAKNMSLSSYSLVLMVIHYLQFKCHPPVLPCLQKMQKDKYNPNADIRSLKLYEDLPDFKSRNNRNLGELFLGFLKYFTDEFNYHNSVMSVRLGTVIPKRRVMSNQSPKNKQGHWKFICIEEPFELTNTARAVFNLEIFEYIRNIFRWSFETLHKTGDLSSIL